MPLSDLLEYEDTCIHPDCYVVHKEDIPENLIVIPDRRVHIMDYGLAEERRKAPYKYKEEEAI